MAKNKYTNIGVVMTAKKDKPDDPTRFYIKLEQRKDKDKKPYGDVIFPITLANGKVLNDGDILAMFSKADQFQNLVDKGSMTQAKADELKGFLRYDVCISEKLNEDGTPAKKDKDDDINF